MKYTDKQIEYFKDRVINGNGVIYKQEIINFILDNGIKIKKNMAKTSAFQIICDNEVLLQKFMDSYANSIDVPYYVVATAYCLTYFQVSELDRLGIINSLPYTAEKDTTLYPFSVLGYKDDYLLNEYEKRYKNDFHRTRIEFDSNDDKSLADFIDKLSNVFDIENMSKLYKKRDEHGYNLYLSIRPKTEAMNNSDVMAAQNANLKTNISILKGEIVDLKERISEQSRNIKETKEYKELRALYMQLKREYAILETYKPLYDDIKKKYDDLKAKYNDLEKSLEQIKSGRPKKLSDQDIETMKLYRIQGKSYRELSKLFNCSIGLISNTLKDFNLEK